MKPKHKVIVLVSVAFLALAALAYVNLQHVRETGRRGISLASEGRGPDVGHQSSEFNLTAEADL
ncbi:hypothetical protein [Streptomyces sp. NPDC059092]|uniref:hypothetical protein n=1 Tax=Streptomyces sp. NPDC059092 TaxID=3346725 RepID=UPI00367EF965